ncbi:MAG: SPFH domain-containing protein [Saprospiraceae bacterium]
MTTSIIFIIIGIIAFFMLSSLIMMFSWHKKVPPEQALVRTGAGGIKVAIDNSIFVIPQMHKQYLVDLNLKRIEVECENQEAVQTKDGILVDVRASFYIRVNRNSLDIIKVMQSIGFQTVNDSKAMNNLFLPKFKEAINAIVPRSNYSDLQNNIDEVKLNLLNHIGSDLHGMMLDDVAIDYVGKT